MSGPRQRRDPIAGAHAQIGQRDGEARRSFEDVGVGAPIQAAIAQPRHDSLVSEQRCRPAHDGRNRQRVSPSSIHASPAEHTRRRPPTSKSTGAGAPPPARTDADASPRISMSSAQHGRRRCTGLGPHPQRELTLMLRLGFPCPRLSMAAGAALALGPHPQRELTLSFASDPVLASRPHARTGLPHPQRELTLMLRLGFPCPRLSMAAGALHWRRVWHALGAPVQVNGAAQPKSPAPSPSPSPACPCSPQPPAPSLQTVVGYAHP